ncbi:MAG: nitrophenyl compound nitroreductase subunit ArsF family protein [Bacteroidales bacterium]|jgi:hypothetical protein|nr:nitrophenyl compound nitroreductase subunit ArsF family protein [Bacteroidales bacterium]
MRRIVLLTLVSLATLITFAQCKNKTKSCCSKSESTTKQETVKQSENNINVYYFHFTRRCVTCNTVEKVTKESIKELYGDKVGFYSLNLEDEKGEKLAKKLNVTGQTLLVVKGDDKTNITNSAFMNARTKPEKLKAKINKVIGNI